MRVAKEVGGVALLIDAKSDQAARWYAGYGALPLLDAPRSMVLSFTVAADAFRRGRPTWTTGGGPPKPEKTEATSLAEVTP